MTIPPILQDDSLSQPPISTPSDPATVLPLTNEPVIASVATPPAIDPNVLAAYNGLLNDRARENTELKNRLTALEAERNAPPQMTPEESSQEFFKDPVKMLRAEIDRAVAPINEDRAQFARAQMFANLKAEMILDSRFTELKLIEPEFDQIMQGQPVNANAMIGAYWAAYGMVAASGKLAERKTPASVTPVASITPAAPIVTTPPHLRPTPPATPGSVPVDNLRALTENEETVRRANGMTKEQYLADFGGGALIMPVRKSQ